MALQRGPFVYCLEEADNGSSLHLFRLATDQPFELVFHDDRDGIPAIKGYGVRYETDFP
ncbi:hypothetical protein [Paenibacillus sp. MBLB4367]|uniref:hypothetical protein n=1 Tax=Paenibacillus sp. MBLB4367 TaxID=3384767 RepID=UPI0039082907